MDIESFRKAGEEILDYLAKYIESIEQRFPNPFVSHGFIKYRIPLQPPENGDKWEKLMQDFEKIIMPATVHLLHPHFHSFFPCGGSNASLLGLMLGNAINSTANTWSLCPASTELEMTALDWIASLFNFPTKFHFYKEGSRGGAVLQGSASECSLMCLYAAQRTSLEKLREQNHLATDTELLSLQTAYVSREANSNLKKNCLITLVNLRVLEADEDLKFRGETLEKAIQEDIKNGFHPFFCAATFGTPSCSAVDRVDELGPICQKYNIWLHVDGAYGLAALSCPEFHHLLNGFEYVTSINTNMNKWLLVHFDCSIMWVEDRHRFARFLSDSSEIHDYPGTPIVDYRTWGATDIRRFRSLKMWFVLRMYGVQGIQNYIRNHLQLADRFQALVCSDNRFEVITKNFGIVCFRLKGPNINSIQLQAEIATSKKLFMSPIFLRDLYVIRFCVDSENAKEKDITYAWQVIKDITDEQLKTKYIPKVT